MVDLIHHGDDRLAAAAQQIGDLLIQGCRPLPPVEQEEDHMGFFNSQLRLAPHLSDQGIVPLKADSAGIDNNEALSPPFGSAVKAVPRNPGNLLFDRRARCGKAIE